MTTTDSSSGDESIDDGFGVPLTKMVCLPSDITIEKKAAKEVTKLLEKHENAAVSRYLRKFLDDWRHQKVCIGVYGDKEHGKSTLINTLRGTNSAYSVSSSCTSPMPYVYPFNSNIQFWELPPIAKDGRYKKEKFMKEINAERYDMLLLLTSNRFSMSSSCWLAKQFEDLGIPVIFVRTKVDEAVDQDTKTHPHTHNLQRCLQRVRKGTLTSLTDNAIHTKFFYLIGAGKPLEYDFADLITSMVDQLKPEKRDAFTLSMIPINSAVIAKKWEILNSRIWVLATASAASGNKVPKCDSKAETDLILEEVRFYRKQLGAQEDAFRKIRDKDRPSILAAEKIRFTKEGMENLLAQAELDQDTDQFVTQMKVVSLRWWMSHLQVGQSFATTCGMLRFLLHNLQIIGLKFLKIQEQERIEKELRREKAREMVNKSRTSTSTQLKSSILTKTSSIEKPERKIRKSKSDKSSRKSSKKSSDDKEDSGQGTSSGEEIKLKKLKKEKKKKDKSSKSEKSESGEEKEKRKKKKKKSSSSDSTEEVKVIRINKVINRDHLRSASQSDKLSTISESKELGLRASARVTKSVLLR